MAASNINRVTITGNLTADPELRKTSGDFPVCKMRVAVNTRRKNRDSGEWEDKPNYFDVTAFGAQGENCSTYLSKGRPVAVDGRLEWSEWESEGGKRQKVEIIADTVQFLGSRDGGGSSGGGNGNGGGFAGGSDVPADTSDFDQPTAVAGGGDADDDIPF